MMTSSTPPAAPAAISAGSASTATPAAAAATAAGAAGPIFTASGHAAEALRQHGYALLAPTDLAALAGVTLAELDAMADSWNHLPPDNYLKDGGRYRRRRHSCFVLDGAALEGAAREGATREGAALEQVPHRAHWQPLEYNALHGGMHRLFEPVLPATVAQPAWPRLIAALGATCHQVAGARPWYIEAHQFRIDTTDGIGRPTPEGAHRDGVDFVAVILVGRHQVKGGETRVFEADGPNGKRFTMTAPWTALLLDDARVIHESTPIQPLAAGAWRDTLVLTYRAGRFQGEAAAG